MSAPPLTLDALSPGTTARVVEVVGDDAVARRLVDLGFWPGSEVVAVRCAPFRDPIEVRIGGYRLALRRAESRRVHLTTLAE